MINDPDVIAMKIESRRFHFHNSLHVESHSFYWRDFWSFVSSGKVYSMHLIERYPEYIYWDELSGNPDAIHILEANINKIFWRELSKNPKAIHILLQYPHKIDWVNFSKNIGAIDVLEANLEKIYCYGLLENHNPKAMHLLEKYLEKHPEMFDSGIFSPLYWYALSENPNALYFLEKYLHIICWQKLSESNALYILEKYTNKLDMCEVRQHPSIVDICFKLLHKLTPEHIYELMNYQTLSGAQFNILFKNKTFVKLTKKDEKHNNLQFETGLNIDIIPFKPYGICIDGGIYFTDIDNMALWVEYKNMTMEWMRYVSIPDDAKVFVLENTFKCDKLVLSERHKITFNNIKKAIQLNGLVLQYVEKQTPELCKLATQQNIKAQKYVKKQHN